MLTKSGIQPRLACNRRSGLASGSSYTLIGTALGGWLPPDQVANTYAGPGGGTVQGSKKSGPTR